MMLSYHNDPAIKRRFLRRVAEHRRADQLIQGVGWEGNNYPQSRRGCAVGCTLHAYDHALYPVELGIPEHLAYLEDSIFEGLPSKIAQRWPERFLRAVPVGVDLSLVWPRFVLWLLREELQVSTKGERVCSLYERVIAGQYVAPYKWRAEYEPVEWGYVCWATLTALVAARAARVPPAVEEVSVRAASAARAYAADAAGIAAVTARIAAGYERQADALIRLLKSA